MLKLAYPTQEYLRELFDYDAETGHMIRRIATKGYHGGRRITRTNDQGYIVTTLDGVSYRVHHFVWIWHKGFAVEEIDHRNRVRNDNRIDNLRPCERVPNCGNTGPRVHKYKGVTFCKSTGRWKAQIGIDYKNISIGRFDTIEQAALAYNEAAIRHFGPDFAYLNNVSA